MRLLVLGGTRFVGRHIVEAALAAGHEVTLFNRGVSDSSFFPKVEIRRGDRSGDHAALASGSWDAVIDVNGYRPEDVRGAMRVLRGRAGLYLFISTISIYRHFENGGAEDAPAWESPAAAQENNPYGLLKHACEKALRQEWGGPWLIARPGLVAGPWDHTDRFTYWPARLARGGAVLAPGAPDRIAQYVDARDLGAWLIFCAERGTTGIFNALGTLNFDVLLRACARAAGRHSPELVWADDAFLLGHGLRPYVDLPLWIPGVVRPFDASKAVAAGLQTRSAAETAADVLRWHRGRAEPALQAGLNPELERRLLAEWRTAGSRRSSPS